MASILTHPVVPLALSRLFPDGSLSNGAILVGMVCSVVPDLDVIGFALGIRYEEVFGHRGFSHSIFFALLLAGLLTWMFGDSMVVFLFLFLSILSHPLLDACTNGGLGIAFFSPFSNGRWFFPWRPLEVPPIGVRAFFSQRGLEVLKSELIWVWLPCTLLIWVGRLLR